MFLQCLPLSFDSIRLTVWEAISFEDFQDGRHGSHLVYRNGMLLAILNFHVAPVPPTKFGLNLTGFQSRCGFKIFKMAAQAPSWIAERNDFSNSEPLCRTDAFHLVSAQFDLWFGKRCPLKNFKMADVAAILNIRTERF